MKIKQHTPIAENSLKTQNKLTLSHNYSKNAGGDDARTTRKARSDREPRSYQLF